MYGENERATKRIDDLLVCGSGTKKIGGKNVFCVLLHHKDFKNVEIYAAAGLVKVKMLGPEEQYFTKTVETRKAQPVNEITEEERPTHILLDQNGVVTDEDIVVLELQGYLVDNDNTPLEEKNLQAMLMKNGSSGVHGGLRV